MTIIEKIICFAIATAISAIIPMTCAGVTKRLIQGNKETWELAPYGFGIYIAINLYGLLHFIVVK
jgi:hypothetical protein